MHVHFHMHVHIVCQRQKTLIIHLTIKENKTCYSTNSRPEYVKLNETETKYVKESCIKQTKHEMT